MEAEILIEYEDKRIARAVAEAVSPDNFKTPADLSVVTAQKGKTVLTKISCNDRLPTFVATVEDLLFCASIAEKEIRAVESL